MIIKRSENKMICEECGSDDFDIFEDEFGDKVAYCMVCGAEYLDVDDDEESAPGSRPW